MERWTGAKLGAGPEAVAAYGFDRVRDTSSGALTGHARVLSVAYDMVF